jgi:hypothetical protein
MVLMTGRQARGLIWLQHGRQLKLGRNTLWLMLKSIKGTVHLHFVEGAAQAK